MDFWGVGKVSLLMKPDIQVVIGSHRYVPVIHREQRNDNSKPFEEVHYVIQNVTTDELPYVRVAAIISIPMITIIDFKAIASESKVAVPGTQFNEL